MSHDLVLVGGSVADVHSGTVRRAGLGIRGGRISAVGAEEDLAASAQRVIDVSGRILVPGYIEPHTHLILASPWAFASALLARGTTTAVVDALPLMTLARTDRLPDLLERLAAMPMTIRWLIRLSPQTFSESTRFELPWIRRLWRLPSAAAVGEVTRWMDVLLGDADLLEKMAAAAADGKRLEGHAAGASFERLAALRQAGFTSCHEAISAQEVADRLRAGLRAMLRHSSIRPDLPALLEAVVGHPDRQEAVMLTIDGPTPRFLADHGYLDHLMRIALDRGLPAMAVLRMVTRTPAAYFGFADRGALLPGARADINVLAALDAPTPVMVIAGGEVMADAGRLLQEIPPLSIGDAFAGPPLPRLPAEALIGGGRPVPGLRLVNAVITEAQQPGAARGEAGSAGGARPGTVHLALVDRFGRWITRSTLTGFVTHLGGLATSFTSGFDPAVLGQSPRDMELALALLADDGGGIVIVEDGRVLFRLPLDLGVWSSQPWPDIVAANRRFADLLVERGYTFADPIYSLLFLTFDSLPWIRVTARGVWDVRRRTVLEPAERL